MKITKRVELAGLANIEIDIGDVGNYIEQASGSDNLHILGKLLKVLSADDLKITLVAAKKGGFKIPQLEIKLGLIDWATAIQEWEKEDIKDKIEHNLIGLNPDCYLCHGSGFITEDLSQLQMTTDCPECLKIEETDCQTCHGTGQILPDVPDSGDLHGMSASLPCPDCGDK